MAKAVKTSKSKKVNSAYSRSSAPQKAAKDNESKIAPTMEAGMTDMPGLAPDEGALKLLTEGIREMYWSENHLTMVLPRMARSATLDALQKVITAHLKETKQQSKRLEESFEMLGVTPKPKKCDVIEALSLEGEKMVEATDPGSLVRDLGIIMVSEKVESYEIAAYKGLIALANSLCFTNVAKVLEASLEEEMKSSEKLEQINKQQLSKFDA